jgi:hypothetical protein
LVEGLERKDDIDFLETFRSKIDQYLFLGYAPTEVAQSREYDSGALLKMRLASQREPLTILRREINEMKPRAKRLMTECSVFPIVEEQSTRHSVLGIMGIPTSERFHMFDLITENRSELDLKKSTVLDAIDQAIGILRHPLLAVETKSDSKLFPVQDYVFISHSSRDTELVSAIKQAFADLSVEPKFFEEKSPGGPPAKEIAKVVSTARALFVFFTLNSISG